MFGEAPRGSKIGGEEGPISGRACFGDHPSSGPSLAL
jgi:hypothetical protein